MRRAAALLALLLLSTAASAADWPQFRGPTSNGHAEGTGYPIHWSEESGIAWKSAIPGQGWSSPVVQGGRVWLTTALEEERSLRAVGIDAASGKIVVDVEAFRPETWQPDHPENSYASPTPALEPGRVYVHFGTYGTALLDAADGRPIWKNDTLKIDHEVGPGSSPLLYKDLLIVHFDGVDKQFVAAFRKDTGEIAWTAPRSLSQEQNAPHKKAFSTPLVVLHEGAPQLISPGADEVVAYDPASGSEIWRVRYEGYSVVPQPAFGHGRVYVDTGYIKPHLLSIRLGGRGDITESHVDWDYHWQVPANPSPLLIDDHIFMVSDWGNATWLDVHSGEDVWRQRLRDSWRASPVYADGRIYLFSVEGKGLVLEAGGEYKEIAVNALEAEIRATPAFADGAIYVRGQTDLYRLDTTSDTADSSGDPADGDS